MAVLDAKLFLQSHIRLSGLKRFDDTFDVKVPKQPLAILTDDRFFNVYESPPPKLFPVILYIYEQTNVWLDNDFHYEPAIIYCYYTLLLSNNCQLSRCPLKLLAFPKHFTEIVLLCAIREGPHVDTLFISVFIIQTSFFKKRNSSTESGRVRLSSS